MRGTQYLHPQAEKLAELLVSECSKQGLNVAITETFRTQAEQDALYAQGRTTSGSIVTYAQYPYSAHCWGVAFDFCKNISGSAYDDSDGFFSKVGAIGKSLGLFWGGDFKSFTDKPHFELPDYMPNNSTSYLLGKYGSVANFQATWSSWVDDTENNDEEDEMVYYTLYENVPDYGQETVKKLMDNGYLKGDENGHINLSEDMLRVFVINDRAGLYA